ncbi:crossover junction endodeoxyribonuclease RuvC [Candidatus Collierbacteria bacterium]|nr:crossover junction endodeoxyribonuclease RuvC [Candidatus Collierbacteria bacterium]
MVILGIDPGTGRLGWAVIKTEKNNVRLLAAGCIETPPQTSLPIRLSKIFTDLSAIIKRYQPDTASVEQLFFATNAKTVMDVGAARGVVLLTCQLENLAIAHYTPLQIKSSLTGYGKADKKQVAFMVAKILKIAKSELPKLDDSVDAIAAALTHSFR